jgi:GMP synthase (glutamine-hydrolysing)
MILIVDCGSKKTGKISENVGFLDVKSKVLSMNSLDSVDMENFSGIIIGGSPIDLRPHLPKFDFVKNLKVPVLGICGGHQAIGMLFGSKISKGRHIKQSEEIQIILKNQLFDGFKAKAFFEEDRAWEINLPKEFLLLAKSKTCGNEAMKHKTKPIYGVQFHPEVSGKNGEKLLENFCKICAEK